MRTANRFAGSVASSIAEFAYNRRTRARDGARRCCRPSTGAASGSRHHFGDHLPRRCILVETSLNKLQQKPQARGDMASLLSRRLLAARGRAPSDGSNLTFKRQWKIQRWTRERPGVPVAAAPIVRARALQSSMGRPSSRAELARAGPGVS